ncbi:MAG TPA: hypothetical protein VGO03_12230 [Acidimicrobiia bacterium]
MSGRTVFASGRDERLRVPVLVVATAAALVALVVALVSNSEPLVAAMLLGAGIVVGEVFVLRWPPAGEVAASYSVFLALTRAVDLRVAVVTIVAAEIVTLAGDEDFRSARWRAVRSAAMGVAIVTVFHLVFATLGHRELVITVLAALLVSAAVGAAIDGSMRHAEREVQQTYWPERALYAWAAVIGTGVLMALAVRGVDGAGALGVRGAAWLSLPLLVIWWSFQQDDASTRLTRQTADALAMVPVLGGAVELGASAHDADLARRVAAQLGLSADEQHTLAVAARLRHLGAVTFDSVIDLTGDASGAALARAEAATSAMLRNTQFDEAGAIVSAASGVAARAGDSPDGRAELLATVVRTLDEFQTARPGVRDPAGAIGALRARHADRRVRTVVDALERVVGSGPA